jgi:hypothetical protein
MDEISASATESTYTQIRVGMPVGLFSRFCLKANGFAGNKLLGIICDVLIQQFRKLTVNLRQIEVLLSAACTLRRESFKIYICLTLDKLNKHIT